MKELGALAVLEIRERPNLAQNLVTHRHKYAINMLTLGIRCTCIILRHIPSWFEAVLAIAILQSCAQGGPKWPFWGQKWPNMAGLPRSQSGVRGSKMIPNDQYNMFLTIWGHFGPIWTLWNHFRQHLIFGSKSLWPRSTLCFLGKKSSFVWNDQKGSKWSQNGPKWSKTCYIDHLGSFWTLLDHFWTSASLPCLAIFGPKRAILDPPAHMIEGWQWPKLLQTNFVYG